MATPWTSSSPSAPRPERPGAPAGRDAGGAEASWLWPAVFLIAFTLLAGLMVLNARTRPRYDVGQVLVRPLLARVEFRVLDREETERRKRDAREQAPTVYDPNRVYLDQARDRLVGLLRLAAEGGELPDSTRQALHLDPRGLVELRLIAADPRRARDWAQQADQLLGEVWMLPLLAEKDAARERDPLQRAHGVVLRHPTRGAVERPDSQILSLRDNSAAFREQVSAVVRLDGRFPPVLTPALVQAVAGEAQETYRSNAEATQQRRQAAEEAEPRVERFFQPGQVVAAAGTALAAVDVDSLESEQQAYLLQQPLGQRLADIAAVLGVLALLGAGMWTYVQARNPRIARNPTRGLAFTGLLLLALLLSVGLTNLQPRFLVATTAFPVLVAVIVLAVAYDRRLALASGIVLALLVSFALDLPAGRCLVLVSGAAAAAGLVDEVRTRSKLALVGLWTGLVMAAAVVVVGPFDPAIRVNYGIAALLALGTGVFTGMLVQSILPAIESVFKVTTAMTLKELTDASHPLLRRLAQEAAGTYQHSLRLADLAEAAAAAIGGDALLCKVGGLYHDVGKLTRPQYFVENQPPGPSPHAGMDPRESLDVILGHVRDGLKLAREHNLPPGLRHFIESHHGTTLVEYFHHAACKAAEAAGAPPPAEGEFRYPGPRPQTREAAVLMLCDSVESAARSLTEPTPPNLEQLVARIAAKRLADGQFDESPLTLQDLHRVQQAAVRTLCAMYHGRVAYPTAAATPAP